MLALQLDICTKEWLNTKLQLHQLEDTPKSMELWKKTNLKYWRNAKESLIVLLMRCFL